MSGAWTPFDVTAIVNGVFDLNAKLVVLVEDVRTIRNYLVDDDGKEEEEEDH